MTEDERVTVDKDALDALIASAGSTRRQRDSEFCCSAAEHEASEAEFKALTDALKPQDAMRAQPSGHERESMTVSLRQDAVIDCSLIRCLDCTCENWGSHD